jgi:hypothetical protein
VKLNSHIVVSFFHVSNNVCQFQFQKLFQSIFFNVLTNGLYKCHEFGSYNLFEAQFSLYVTKLSHALEKALNQYEYLSVLFLNQDHIFTFFPDKKFSIFKLSQL